MKVKPRFACSISSLQRQRKKPVCVTNFTYILLEDRVHSAVCVLVSSKITFLQSIFAGFLVVLGHFWLYEEFDDRYPKSLCKSRKQTSVTIFIKAFIPAYDSGCKSSPKMTTLHQL